MRKGWMAFVGFLGILVLVGGLLALVRAPSWLGSAVSKYTIAWLNGAWAVVILAGLVIFWVAVFYYVQGMAIRAFLPPSGKAYCIISIGQIAESKCKHLVLKPLDWWEVYSLYFCLKADRIPEEVRPGDKVVRVGNELRFLVEKDLPPEAAADSEETVDS